MISYEKLFSLIKSRGIKKAFLKSEIGLFNNTMDSLMHNKDVSTKTINSICNYFKCQPNDIMEWIPDDIKTYEESRIVCEIHELEEKIEELKKQLKELQA